MEKKHNFIETFFNKLSRCVDVYIETVEVFNLFLEAFGNTGTPKDAFHNLGEIKGYVMSINGLIRYAKPSDLWEEFRSIKAKKISTVFFDIQSAIRDSYGFLFLIEKYSEKVFVEEPFTNFWKQTKTMAGILLENLKEFVEDPNTDMGHAPIPKLYSFNVDIESVASDMLSLINKLSEKDLNLTNKDETITIGEKLTPELKFRLNNLKNDYYFPPYGSAEALKIDLIEDDFKNLDFRQLFYQEGILFKNKIDKFKKDFNPIYYGRH